jgi:cell division protein FtsB
MSHEHMTNNNERQRKRQITNNFAEAALLSKFSRTIEPSIHQNFLYDFHHLNSVIQKLQNELEETRKQLYESKNEINLLKYQNYNLRRGIQEVQTISEYIQPHDLNQFSNVELPFNNKLNDNTFKLHTEPKQKSRGVNKSKKKRTRKKK